MKVKIFSDWYVPRVEEQFNAWMAENENKVECGNIVCHSSSDDQKVHHTIMVFYTNIG